MGLEDFCYIRCPIVSQKENILRAIVMHNTLCGLAAISLDNLVRYKRRKWYHLTASIALQGITIDSQQAIETVYELAIGHSEEKCHNHT